MKYDAVLIVSFGGPEGMDDVMPFLRNVLRGKRVPEERVVEVARHYEQFGGVSPINGQIRDLISALEKELAGSDLNLPVYWGNRNWHPFLADTLRRMRDDGIKSALAFVTSAYGSYSGCRQYLEDLGSARDEVGEGVPVTDKLRYFYNHPLFIQANAQRILETLDFDPKDTGGTRVIFTAHSIPLSMASACNYESELKETCRLVAAEAGMGDWKLVYQSRSGPPHQPWLEPDICDYLESLDVGEVGEVVIVPIGFLSDHLEVIYDLDTEARQVCQKLGIKMRRVSTVGTHPAFIQMIRELIEERMTSGSTRAAIGSEPAPPDTCPEDCCYFSSR